MTTSLSNFISSLAAGAFVIVFFGTALTIISKTDKVTRNYIYTFIA